MDLNARVKGRVATADINFQVFTVTLFCYKFFSF